MARPSASAARLLTLLTLALSWLSPATSASADQLDFDVIFGDNAGGKFPSQVTWAPDGTHLSYVWDDGEGEEEREALWILDLATGVARTRLLTEEVAVDSHQWSADGTQLLIDSDGSAQLLAVEGGEPRRLTGDGGEEDPKFAPNARSIAFVRDYDLHLFEVDSGTERTLTTGGEKNQILNGVTDWVYWEELWGRDSTGYWWSPDSSKIAYYRFDETPVDLYPLVNFLPTYPEVDWQRYPKSGQALPIVKVGVLDVASGETVWLETATPEDHYFPRVTWSPDGASVIVTQLNRDQNQLDLLSCDPGSGACTRWFSESWATWVNLHDDFRWLADGGFLWSSQKSGFRALYLHDAEGREVRRLSPEGLSVGSVKGFNREQQWVIYDAFTIGELGAKDRAIYRQDLAGGYPTSLSATTGFQRANVSDATGNYVLTQGSSDTPNQISLRGLDGSEFAARLPSKPPEGYDPASLPRWEYMTIPGPGEDRLPAALLKPADFDPAQSYPVIMYHYGCPSSQVVTDAWGGRSRALWHMMMAQRGYLVLKVDNGASNFFGKHGEDRAYRSFGPGNVMAQEAGVEYLATLGYADTDRIGLWGWSGGGYNTLYALTHSPGTWRAGVAGAPVADWTFYDAIWTERYMDTPQDNPAGYATASALDAADQLEDALLIVHGTADDNVHPQNTIAMSAKLIAAGKPFEQAIHPRQKHGFRTDDSRHFYERMTEFFVRQLAPAAQPEVAPAAPRGATP